MMEGYNLLRDTIISELESIPFVNVVTDGLGDEIDLSKQTIFPLAHLVILSAQPSGNAVTCNFELYCLDIVDISDNGTTDNKHDVLNTQYNVGLRMYESLRRGHLWEEKLEVSSWSMDLIEQAYENFLAGWKISASVLIPNHMSKC
jgi:hypothetical protein